MLLDGQTQLDGAGSAHPWAAQRGETARGVPASGVSWCAKYGLGFPRVEGTWKVMAGAAWAHVKSAAGMFVWMVG